MNYLLRDKKKTTIFITISAISAVYMLCFLPDVFRYTTGQEVNGMTFALATSICAILALLMLVLLFMKNNRMILKNVLYSVLKIIVTAICIMLVSILISMLIGILAVGIDSILKDRLSFSQIKGIINIISLLLSLLIFPNIIAMFWAGVNSEKNIIKDLIKGFVLNVNRYFSLAAYLIITFVVGMLINVGFQYFNDNLVSTIIKIMLLTLVGFFSIAFSEYICIHREYKGGGK